MRNERRSARQEEIDSLVSAHPGWEQRDGGLHRTYRFPSFVAAFGFMASAALIAERMDHHPDWRNAYGTVEVQLRTHDIGGVSPDDLALARAMEGLAAHEPHTGSVKRAQAEEGRS